MSNRAWMPLHIENYIADTDHLTATEHGAYLLLIMKYWRDSGLPDDEGMIRRYAKLTPEQWAESRDVLAAFFDEGWRHKRIDAELAKADEIIEKRRNAANRRHGNSTSDAHAQQVRSTCSDTGVPPRTNNQSSSLRSDEGQGVSAGPTPSDRAFKAFCDAVEDSPIPAPRKLTADRRRKLDARLREHGEDVWREACQRLVQSPFCRGENDRGWTADLDFLLQPKSLNRLIEGGYDARKPPPRGQPPPQQRTVSDVLGEIANGTYNPQGQNHEPDYATIETGFQRRN